jgi:signal transduction histidine kinase
MPTTIFCIGMLSIVLLLWAGWISEKQRSIAGFVDTIMDVQIRTATSHLSLEEAIAGDTQVDVEKVTVDIDQAIKQSNLFCDEGKYEFKRIATPFADQDQPVQGEEIKSLLVKFKMLGLARLRSPAHTGLGTSMDSEFHNTYKEILTKSRILEDKVRTDHAANQKKSRHIFLSMLVIWVPIVITATTGLWNRERRKKKAEEEVLEANKRLLAQAEELTGHREHLAAIVEKRTAELTTANELLQAEIAEHKQTIEIVKETDKQIRHLSSRLINAQEVERRRISMELHDELGQALNATKLHMRAIEKGLKKDQETIREQCEVLISYMDSIIENVRRLSLALSPTVLEELGLTAALKWLLSTLSKVPNLKTTVDIEEIDRFLPRNDWIIIYRIIQEIVANIGKHSSADNVFVDIHRRDNSVHFLIQDNGKGFNLEQQYEKNISEKGLGLATMSERIKAIGGVLDLWSQETKGTRIVISVPLETKEI